MADIAQLESALIKADQAGDAEGARILAGEIRRLRTAPTMPQNGQVVSAGRDNFSSQGGSLPQAEKTPVSRPQRSTVGDFLGGVKKAGTDTVLGLRQLAAMAGMGDEAALAKEAEAVKARDAELMDTGAGMAGNIVGQIGTMLIPGGALLKLGKAAPALSGLSKVGNAITAPKTLSGAAALGAATGAIQPAVNNEERITNALIGGTGGAAGHGVVAGVGRVLSPKTDAAVKALMDQGVTPTPGQVLGGVAQRTEDKLMSVPLLGDAITMGRKRAERQLNQAAYARALVGTGVDAKTLPVGPEGISAVKDAISKQYNDLLPKLAFTPDNQFMQEIGKIQQMTAGMGAKEQAKFNALMDDVLNKASPNGSMIGETYKRVESKLAKEAKRFSGSNDAYQQELGAALGEVLNSMKSNLTRSNPQYAKALAQANSNYANYVRLRTAGSMAGDQSKGFSPSQLDSAVRRNDSSAGDGATATGQALMRDLSAAGQSVLGSKYPDSGTVGRGLVAGALGGAAFSNPATLAVGAAAIPYTPAAQKVIAALLAQRPDLARSLGNAFQSQAPRFALPGAAIANTQE